MCRLTESDGLTAGAILGRWFSPSDKSDQRKENKNDE